MTAVANLPGSERPPDAVCGEPRTWNTTDVCENVAGWGTDHKGTGPCRHHDTPATRTNKWVDKRVETADRIIAEHRLAVDYLRKHPEIPHPAMHLLEEIAYTKSQLDQVRERLNAIQDLEGWDGVYTHGRRDLGGPLKHALTLQERLTKLIDTAVSLGIDERRVRIAEEQASVLITVMRTTLHELGLTSDQQFAANQIMSRLFREFAVETREVTA